jgi:predicted metal-dependent hydrolase
MTTDRTTTERRVPTRRMSFEASLATVPQHFAGDGNVLMSHLWASMSAVFPDGEDFFVRSVRHYRDRIDDPVLKRQVAGFIGQEAMHGREHRVFNDRLAELGYPVEAIATWSRRFIQLRERLLPAQANLALTVTLEHVTALLAEVILTDEETQRLLGHEAVRDVFFWHALEESEHKAVAFDVYRSIGGSERLRIWTMRLVRHGLLLGMVLQVLAAVALDPSARERGRVRRSWRGLRRSALFRKELWQALKDFERPDFHPDDRDTSTLLEEWRERLFGADGALNDRLVGTAA